jgi:acetyl esterase/lipase
VLQLLVYPMLDDRTPRRAVEHDYRMWSPRSNRFGWAAYLGAADPQVAVPARRQELNGLPPAWIGVGDRDILHDEDLAYAERLKDAGVPCQVEVVPGAFHVFDRVAIKAEVSQRFLASQCAGLRAALRPQG